MLIGRARGRKQSGLPAEGIDAMHGISPGRISTDNGPIAAEPNRNCTA